jgi:hypothetical protein
VIDVLHIADLSVDFASVEDFSGYYLRTYCSSLKCYHLLFLYSKLVYLVSL